MRHLRWIIPMVAIFALAGGIVGAKVLSVKAAAEVGEHSAKGLQAGADHGCPPGYDGCAAGDPCPDCQEKTACPMESEAAATAEEAVDQPEAEKPEGGCPMTTGGGHGKGMGMGKGASGGCPFTAGDEDKAPEAEAEADPEEPVDSEA